MADKNMNAKINVDFEESTSRQSLNSGDSLPTLFGKIKKFFSDLKTVCFSGSYNDLSDKPTTATTEVDGLMSAEDKTKLDNADDTYALKSLYGDTTINVGRKAGTDVGQYSIVIGHNSSATKQGAVAEGMDNTASGYYSHAEGMVTTASGYCSHSEGMWSTADGEYSHAGGKHSKADGCASFAHGWYVNAFSSTDKNAGHAAFGMYNLATTSTLFSIGDGTADNARHNAFEITATGGKLHDKDIATTDLIPTTLPANGGNADTVGNLDAYHMGTTTYAGTSYPPEQFPLYCQYNVYNDDRFAFKIDNSCQPDSEYEVRCDYAGNAGDADTLDGKHASDFIYARGYFDNIDLDDIKYPCSGLALDNCTHIPSNVWGTLLVYTGGTGSFTQIYISTEDDAAPPTTMYFRHHGNTRWSEWKEISTTPIKSTGWITSPTDQYGTIILPNSSTRRYLSITAVGCYAEMFSFNDEYTVHIVNGNYEKIINTPVTYIAFYIE